MGKDGVALLDIYIHVEGIVECMKEPATWALFNAEEQQSIIAALKTLLDTTGRKLGQAMN